MRNIGTYKKYYKNYKKNSYGTGTLCSGIDKLN
jgi:hypothetical protein